MRERGLKFFRSLLNQLVVGSLPLRERGLKLTYIVRDTLRELVAPLAGAWIEIWDQVYAAIQEMSRSPCGSVD